MAPKTQQDLMRQALKENWPPEVFVNEARGAGLAEADVKATGAVLLCPNFPS